MASQITNYQCPACTGPMHFDGSSGKLVCDYCDSTFTVEEIEALYKSKNEQAEAAFEQENEKSGASESAQTTDEASAEAFHPNSEEWDTSSMSDNWQGDAASMKSYICPSCGAEMICEATTAATSCPYCGNPTVMPGQFSGALKPDLIIPFKIKKEQAIETLRNHYKGKKLLPKVFAAENHIQEVQGMYVPFWLFDGKVDADIMYTGEVVRVTRTRKYEITSTSYFDLERAGTVTFNGIPVDASKKMDDALMDSLEPYDYSELKEFQIGYLPGFLADKYDVSVKECAERADKRAYNTTRDEFRSHTQGYTAVAARQEDMKILRGKVRYALLPVWILNTKWQDQQYTFAMNGQTGQIVGNLPMDKGLYWKWRLIYGGIIGAALYGIALAASLFL